MPQLIFYIEGDYPQVHHLTTEKVTIGRNKDNDIRVASSSVSVYHAELITMVDGSYQIKDLDSSNGTVINQETVTQKILTDGDKLKFGTVKAVYVDIKPNPSSRAKQIVGIEGLEKEAESLLRKTEIERNNLLLLRNEIAIARQRRLDFQEGLKEVDAWEKERKAFRDDRQRALTETEQALNRKKELEAGQIRLQQELENQKKGLEAEKVRFAEELDKEKKRLEADKLQLNQKLEGEKKELEAGKIRRLQELEAEMESLSRECEQTRTEIEKNRIESDAAVLVIDKGKAIEATIGGLENDLKGHQSALDELNQQIAGQKKTCETLEQTISERKKDYDQVEIELAGRKSELSDLNHMIATRQSEVDRLAEMAHENNTLIQSASQKLVEMESASQKGWESLAETQKMDQSLKNESGYLSRLITEKTIVLQRLKGKINSRILSEKEAFTCPPLRVIHPGMRSLMHYFHQGAGLPELSPVEESARISPAKPGISPSGIFALAACTKGSLHRDMDSILAPEDPVLLLLSGDPETDRRRIENAISQGQGRILLVGWAEGQLNSLLSTPGREQVVSLLARISGHISVDPDTAKLIGSLDLGIPHLNLDLPCPIEVPEWNLSTPLEKRTEGVFLAGDGFDSSSLLHRTRISLLNDLVAATGVSVTIHQQDPGADIAGLNLPTETRNSKLETQNSQPPTGYADYLALMGRHHFVMSFGQNPFGGDVFGDALLARTIYLGANFENPLHELIFPDSCIKGGDFSGALEHAKTVLNNRPHYLDTMKRSETLASQLYSFQNTRDRLGEFIHELGSVESIG